MTRQPPLPPDYEHPRLQLPEPRDRDLKWTGWAYGLIFLLIIALWLYAAWRVMT